MFITERVPWKDHMGGVPLHLEYPQGSMFDAVREIAEKYPDNIAFPATASLWSRWRPVPRA